MKETRQCDVAGARQAACNRMMNSGIDRPQAGIAPIDSVEYRHGLSRVAILTGGGDRPYALGLASALISQGIALDFIASDELDDPSLREHVLVNFLNLRKEMRADVSSTRKVARVLLYYWRLLIYAATAKTKLFHILWNNKFVLLDRTVLMLYYKALGKRIVLTVHNVNAGLRDGNDSAINRLTLRIQYRLSDHFFVHTEQMKRELCSSFKVPAEKVSVIPFGINSTVPNTGMKSEKAKARIGLSSSDKAILFFGNIAPYKGLEHLVQALSLLVARDPNYRLLIAGRPKNCASYWEEIQRQINSLRLQQYIIEKIEYIPDEETEIYFKAADLLILPYVHIFQSGVLFLGYNFGLPVVATDVGSLREEILEGQTGFVCSPGSPSALAEKIQTYFSSNLYRQLPSARSDISAFAAEKYSWTKVGEITRTVYARWTN
jgi:glycosyltransferase involved in cell wall biosynthesis